MQSPQQLRYAVIASNFLFAGFALSLLLWRLHLLSHPQPTTVKPLNSWVVGSVYLLIVSWYYAIRIGKQWAKYLLLVLFIGGSALSLLDHPERLLHTWRTSWLAALSYAVAEGTQLWALILLFRK